MDRQAAETLPDFASAGEDRELALLSLQPALLAAVQDRLTHHGLLDPPPDRFLGPDTTWALVQFARVVGAPFRGALTPAMAHRLLDPDPVLPLQPGDDLPGRLIATMLAHGHWVCRHPDAFTITYVEHTEPDGTASRARPDAFDDARFLLRLDRDGRPALVGAWHATTRSGRDALVSPTDVDGPPILQPGQYKAWVMGRTAIGTELEQDALIQSVELPVIRDADVDGNRHGDPGQRGLFVIDQHGGLDAPRDAVGGTGAGCLVGRSQADHDAFLASLRTDPRYRANNAYRFMAALLTPQDFDPPLHA